MLQIDFDTSAITKAASDLGATIDQIPYVMARTLNDAAEVTRKHLINQTWPQSVTVRNTAFMNASLTTRGARATKSDLEVTIYDKLGRANLALHAKGGVRTAKQSAIAIPPTGAVTRGTHGVPTGQRPRNLRGAVRIGDAIFQRQRKRLKLMYVLRPAAVIRRDVPFYADFGKIMYQEMMRALPRNVSIAMKTRFVK
jgi:hypothetical protein